MEFVIDWKTKLLDWLALTIVLALLYPTLQALPGQWGFSEIASTIVLAGLITIAYSLITVAAIWLMRRQSIA